MSAPHADILQSQRDLEARCLDPWEVAAQPLLGVTTDPQPYPFDALGDVMGDAARALHTDLQVPDALAGNSVLANAALAVQIQFDVRGRFGPMPTSLYLLTVGESGDGKSLCDAVAGKPVTEYQREHAEEARRAVTSYEKALRRWQADDSEKPEPKRPIVPILTVQDPTIEGIARHLSECYPAIGLFNAEGGQVIGGHAMNRDNRRKTTTWLTSLFDGGSITTMRAGAGYRQLSNRRMSVHLMLQPSIAEEFARDSSLIDQGFLPRFLMAAPVSRAGSREYSEADPRENALVQPYYEAIRNLLSRDLPIMPGTWADLAPAVMEFDAAAKAMLPGLFAYVEERLKPTGELRCAKGFADRVLQHATRIAAVIAAMQGATIICHERLMAAIQLALYYLGEYIRVTGAEARHGTSLKDVLKVQCFASQQPNGAIGSRALQNRTHITAERVRVALETLEARGLARRIPGKWHVNDDWHEEVWQVRE